MKYNKLLTTLLLIGYILFSLSCTTTGKNNLKYREIDRLTPAVLEEIARDFSAQINSKLTRVPGKINIIITTIENKTNHPVDIKAFKKFMIKYLLSSRVVVLNSYSDISESDYYFTGEFTGNNREKKSVRDKSLIVTGNLINSSNEKIFWQDKKNYQIK